MEWLGIIGMIGIAVLYYKLTTPEERMQAAQHRQQTSNRILGGGFNILSFLVKRKW